MFLCYFISFVPKYVWGTTCQCNAFGSLNLLLFVMLLLVIFCLIGCFFVYFFFFSFFSLRLFHFSNISRDFPAFYHATSNPRDLLSLLITIFLFFTDQPHTHTRTLSNTLSLAFLNPFTSRLFSILFFHLLPSNF